jgi:hypothetical protein
VPARFFFFYTSLWARVGEFPGSAKIGSDGTDFNERITNREFQEQGGRRAERSYILIAFFNHLGLSPISVIK